MTPPATLRSEVVFYSPATTDTPDAPAGERWGWLELFVAMQLISSALLFLPGAQSYRTVVRAMPYGGSLVALVHLMFRGSRDPLTTSARWLLMSFALLAANLLNPSTHLEAGVAQIIFQIAIAAPMFWVPRVIGSQERFARLLWIILGASFLSAALGVLQVYYPDRFLPPEFSALGLRLNPEAVRALTYIGPNGSQIVRPPGLSDLPGG